MKKKIKLKKLVKKVQEANEAYRDGSPFIDDVEYDVLTEKIKELDPENEFINSVEKEKKGKREEFKHPEKMLSIEKAFSIDEVIKFFDRCKVVSSGRFQVKITPKLDGIAARKYPNGFVTRGDGEIGYIIPRSISRFLKYSDDWERNWTLNNQSGEIVVSNDNFEKYLKGKYSHPRNFVAGLVNTDKLNDVQKKALKNEIVEFIIHESQNISETITFDSRTKMEEVKKVIEEYLSIVKEKNIYPIDGVVFTVKDIKLREELGETNHHYKWQIALKDQINTIETVVLDIEYQVGRTGLVTPVLKIETVELSGAKISSVTAHNVQMLIDEQIGIGSRIEIIRSGEIIPKIVDVLTHEEPEIPKICPSCAKELKRDGLFLKCENKLCNERLVQSVFHWFKCLDNSDWFGVETIRKLSKNGYYLINKIYDMQEDDFVSCGFGKVQSKNLWESLIQSKVKEIPDWKLLAAFGVPGIERGLSKKILSKYKISQLTSLKKKSILAIEGFGEKIASNFMEWMDENKDLLNELILDFHIVHSMEASIKKCNYSGMNILFTGSIEGFTREEIKKMADENGINSGTSVSKNTNLVVVGENPGLSKLEKAEKLGIKIITFKEFKENM